MGGGGDAGAWCAGGVGVAALNVPFSIFIGLNGKIIGGSRKGSFGEEAFEPVVWFGVRLLGVKAIVFAGGVDILGWWRSVAVSILFQFGATLLDIYQK